MDTSKTTLIKVIVWHRSHHKNSERQRRCHLFIQSSNTFEHAFHIKSVTQPYLDLLMDSIIITSITSGDLERLYVVSFSCEANYNSPARVSPTFGTHET